jgi:hypothetical protein
LVHLFIGTIMLEQNIRTGYFDQVKWLSLKKMHLCVYIDCSLTAFLLLILKITF